MARVHAEEFAAIPGVSLAAAVDTRPEVLAAFRHTHAIPRGFGTLEEALAWGEFDAVANVTPDAAHYRTTLPVIAAGKHVLCEKPLATDHASARAMSEAAEAAGVVNMINLSYRNMPAMHMAADMVARGAIGEVRHFEASYLQSWLTQDAWGDWRAMPQWLWRLSTMHGSKGTLGDIGIHIVDFATFVAGSGIADLSCRLATFPKAPGNRIGDYALDANDSFTMHVALDGGAVGTIGASRFASGHLNDLSLRIYGTRGGLDVALDHVKGRLRACLEDDLPTATWRTIRAPRVPSIYQRFIAAIRGEGAADPNFARGAQLQDILDRAEASGRPEPGLRVA